MRTIENVFRHAARSCGLPVAPDTRVPAATEAKYRSVSLSDATARWDPALGIAYQLLDHHKDASAFSSFLMQLADTENYRTDPDFHAIVVALISRLIEHKDLRETCFAISRRAITAHGNSIVGAFNYMAWARAVADIETGLYDGRPEKAIALIRQIFRCDQLLNVVDEASRHLQERRDADRAEFYRTYHGSLNDALVPRLWLADRADIELTYQVCLRNRLELHLCIKYIDTAHILHNSPTDSEITAAELLVKKAENKTFDAYLSCSRLWQGYLERMDPVGFKNVGSTLKKVVRGKSFRGLAGTALTDEATHRHFGALTRRYLKSAGKMSLLDSSWPLLEEPLVKKPLSALAELMSVFRDRYLHRPDLGRTSSFRSWF